MAWNKTSVTLVKCVLHTCFATDATFLPFCHVSACVLYVYSINAGGCVAVALHLYRVQRNNCPNTASNWGGEEENLPGRNQNQASARSGARSALAKVYSGRAIGLENPNLNQVSNIRSALPRCFTRNQASPCVTHDAPPFGHAHSQPGTCLCLDPVVVASAIPSQTTTTTAAFCRRF